MPSAARAQRSASAKPKLSCRVRGLPGYRFGDGHGEPDYISLWNGDAIVLFESLELVQRTAAEIIAAITPDKPLPLEGGG